MFHREVTLSAEVARSIDLTINCFDAGGQVPAVVPDDVQAAADIVSPVSYTHLWAVRLTWAAGRWSGPLLPV